MKELMLGDCQFKNCHTTPEWGLFYAIIYSTEKH